MFNGRHSYYVLAYINMLHKLNREIFSLLLALISQVVFTQSVVRTTGTAQLELTDDKSRLEIISQLRQLATIDALEKAFGRVIFQGNATYVTNIQTGQQEAQTNTVFHTIANTFVKGEVVRELDVSFTNLL